jgi:hypothetical protein
VVQPGKPFVDGERAKVDVVNGTKTTQSVVLACYTGPISDPNQQELVDSQVKTIPAGGERTFSVSIACGEKGQCDVALGRRPKEPPWYGGDLLIGFHTDGDECPAPPPTTCEPNCPKECVEKDCPNGYTFSLELCGCVKDPPCTPHGAPQCPEQRWNETLCLWEGLCPCEPEGVPECPEQSWNKDSCSWVGECPKPCVLKCDFGYELDEKECKCEPLPLCHVSNKGGDGDWNIVESQKKFSPGHEKHLDISKFCPPDYFGTCDGRYDEAEDLCQQ